MEGRQELMGEDPAKRVGIGNGRSGGIRGQRSEVRGQRSEVRGQRSGGSKKVEKLKVGKCEGG
jgi:hypothetical protein